MHSRSHAIDEIDARNNIVPILVSWPGWLADWVLVYAIGTALIVEHTIRSEGTNETMYKL